MNYEEYRERMVAQKREPATREAYDAFVEPAYMATEMDKDEFCKLPGRAIDALGSQARAINALKAEVRQLNAEAKAATDSAQRLGDEYEAAKAKLADAEVEADRAREEAEKEELRAMKLEQLLKQALAKQPVETLVDEIVRMATGASRKLPVG